MYIVSHTVQLLHSEGLHMHEISIQRWHVVRILKSTFLAVYSQVTAVHCEVVFLHLYG